MKVIYIQSVQKDYSTVFFFFGDVFINQSYEFLQVYYFDITKNVPNLFI